MEERMKKSSMKTAPKGSTPPTVTEKAGCMYQTCSGTCEVIGAPRRVRVSAVSPPVRTGWRVGNGGARAVVCAGSSCHREKRAVGHSISTIVMVRENAGQGPDLGLPCAVSGELLRGGHNVTTVVGVYLGWGWGRVAWPSACACVRASLGRLARDLIDADGQVERLASVAKVGAEEHERHRDAKPAWCVRRRRSTRFERAQVGSEARAKRRRRALPSMAVKPSANNLRQDGIDGEGR
eukprot:1202322-Pleurochrysis_carterae.AAC.1